MTHDVKEAHVSRLKYYHDRSLNVNEDLIQQVAHSQGSYEVEDFGSVRYNAKTKNYEVEIKWRGLGWAESSFEPVANIMEDVPMAFKSWLPWNGPFHKEGSDANLAW